MEKSYEMGAKLKVISSGSCGNSYVLDCGSEILLLELGVSWNEILKAIGYKEGFRKVVGCLVSHIHRDHILPSTLKKAKSRGVQIYSCKSAAEMYDIHEVKPKSTFQLGNFTIQTLPLEHNAECYGYIIRHPEFGKLVFATDCKKFPYIIESVNHLLIECNYDDDVVLDNFCNAEYSKSASENHLELQACKWAVKNNISSQLINVVLLHQSQGNCNEEKNIKEVSELVPCCNVIAANAGVELELDSNEF